MPMPEFNELPDDIKSGIQSEINEKIKQAVTIGEKIFGYLYDVNRDARWDPESAVFEYDDESIELAKGISEEIAMAIQTGDFDAFAAGLANIIALPSFADKSRAKWDLFPMVVRHTWRFSRDAMKETLKDTVDDFLKDIFSEENE